MTNQNPYAPPHANVTGSAVDADIDSLPVSDTWKTRFKAIRKAGGPRLPKIKELSREERKAVAGFNILAFLFGPFYYLFKGMWRKGIVLFVLCVVGVVILEVILRATGLGAVTKVLSFGIAAVYAALANADYYRKMVLGENGWWW